jgi:hypothetical protein
MSNGSNERNPARLANDDAPRTALIQPRRNPDVLFRGWGPKLF